MLLIKIPMFFQVCRPTSMNTVSQLQKTCENKYLQVDENCIMIPEKNSGSTQLLRSPPYCICFRVITLLFVVGLKYCLVKMIVITRQTACHVTGRPGSKFFSGPLRCCLWWNLDTCVVFGTISVFTFVYFFQPLIVIFQGAISLFY